MSTLYIVATPIGNLEDLSPRAARILGEADRIVAEDTRRTGNLLQHLGVRVPMTSLHAHNEASREEQILAWLDEGQVIALVSDAGTPAVSDPGERTVRAAREAGHCVVPIPGPSAVLAALVGSGITGARFAFLGFVPRKGSDRRSTLERIERSKETVVVFESPERLLKLLEALDAFGDGREICVARELTKIHEEFRRGTARTLYSYYLESGVKGEVSVVIAAAPEVEAEVSPEAQLAEARGLIEAGLAAGEKPTSLAKRVARATGLPRNHAYEMVRDVRDEEDEGDTTA